MISYSDFWEKEIKGPSLRIRVIEPGEKIEDRGESSIAMVPIDECRIALCVPCTNRARSQDRIPPDPICSACAPYWWELCRISGNSQDAVFRAT